MIVKMLWVDIICAGWHGFFETINRNLSSPWVPIPDGAGKIGVGFFCPFSSRERLALNERISRSRGCRLG